MLEPFIWMFKTKNFKKHFWYLFFVYIKFWLPAIVCCVIGYNLFNTQLLLSSILLVVAFALMILPAYCIQGYFWEMAEAVITRGWDIKAASVYNGKVSSIYSVSLPEIHTLKFIWRGFASSVATVIMFIPLILIVSTTIFTGVFALPMLNINMFENTYVVCYLILLLFYIMFIPALLWNYAYRNSVVSVLNIRKAIYIIGNYPGKYFWNAILYFVFNTLTSYIVNFLVSTMKLYQCGFNLITIIHGIIIAFIAYLMYIYSLFVYAYLLGTITPPGEG